MYESSIHMHSLHKKEDLGLRGRLTQKINVGKREHRKEKESDFISQGYRFKRTVACFQIIMSRIQHTVTLTRHVSDTSREREDGFLCL